MRWLIVVLGAGSVACATTGAVCPPGARLASVEQPSGRAEWCATTTAGITAMPVPGRAYANLLGMAHPGTLSGGLRGPFTHWHPTGAVESHGSYVEDGASSVPDGVWGFWYADGARRSLGRYERGRPVGCFAMWDEQGSQITGVVEGEQLRVEPCDPPPDAALRGIEARSHPAATRTGWGDVALHAVAAGGALGAHNPTQRDPDPAARAGVQFALRTQVGRLRIGGGVGLRLADTDAQGYTASAVVGLDLPLPHPRLGAELEVQLGVQYLDLTASRPDLPGVASLGLWSPHGVARAGLSVAVTRTLRLTAGARLEGAPPHDVDQEVRYCAPLCGPPIAETWRLGGAAYGLDLGVRVLLR